MKRFIYEITVLSSFGKTRRGSQVEAAVRNFNQALIANDADFQRLKFELKRFVERINNDFKGRPLELRTKDAFVDTPSGYITIGTNGNGFNNAEVSIRFKTVEAEPTNTGIAYALSFYPSYQEKGGAE
ncbi:MULTISPECIES: hypothetical protein [Muribaculaceae]|uniref:hypothetical protein n=1 Tax=Muribaculaceae TaxID=2005473 RepID=UPI002659B626|nr:MULTISPECIES: hypothetical protein [Muribaculaceae]